MNYLEPFNTDIDMENQTSTFKNMILVTSSFKEINTDLIGLLESEGHEVFIVSRNEQEKELNKEHASLLLTKKIKLVYETE